MHTINAQYDSFSLANITLQNRTHNRKHWANIERETRYLTYKHDEAYVVTGISIKEAQVNQHGVIIPSYFFKAVYLPKLDQAFAYWSRNTANHDTQIITLHELQEKTGLDVMPTLAKTIKTSVATNHSTTVQTQPSQKANQPISIWSQLIQFFSELLVLLKKLF